MARLSFLWAKSDSYTWNGHEKNIIMTLRWFSFSTFLFSSSFFFFSIFGWFKFLWLSSCGCLSIINALTRRHFQNNSRRVHRWVSELFLRQSIKICVCFSSSFLFRVPFFIAFYDCAKSEGKLLKNCVFSSTTILSSVAVRICVWMNLSAVNL